MLSLEEAIKHCEEVAEEKEQEAQRWMNDGWQSCFKTLTPEREAQYLSERKRLYYQCLECASEHRQLAEWLRKLKTFEEAKERIIEVSWEHTFTFSDKSESMTYKICALDTILEILGGVIE